VGSENYIGESRGFCDVASTDREHKRCRDLIEAGLSEPAEWRLNTLLVSIGQKTLAIDQFLSVFSVGAALQPAWDVRDHIGAHLEIDEIIPLSALLGEIDSFNLESCLAFF
jgi:hypothetical protein